jgi:hypothetical protein
MSKAKKAEIGINAKSLDEVIKKCKIDTRVWEVESYSSKELANGEFLWTVYFKKKKYVVDWEAFKKDLISYAPTPEKVSYPKEQGGLLWEYSAPDLHLCKLAHKEETGENYDYKIAKEVFNKTLNDALEKVKPYKIDKIIFPCGNDFLNSDTLNNTTTAGTPQDSDSRHFKMFREGYKLLISAILKLKKVAPVEVLIVLGNHSTVSEMHIGELLEVYFRNDPDVTVNNSAAPRKYIKHGVNLIGFVHGNLEKHNKLQTTPIDGNRKAEGMGFSHNESLAFGPFASTKDHSRRLWSYCRNSPFVIWGGCVPFTPRLHWKYAGFNVFLI